VLKTMEEWDPGDRRPMIVLGRTTKGYWPAAVDGKIPGAGDQIVGFPSHPFGFKMNSEYIVSLARTFEQRYGVQFAGIGDGPVTDPRERLRKVHEAMMEVKKSGSAVGAHALSRLGDFAPPQLLAQAARLQAVTRMFNLVVTNVPGPQFPLYLLGKEMLRCFPQVPLAAQQALGVALLSYNGQIGAGLLGDADAARDLPALAAAMNQALDELNAAG